MTDRNNNVEVRGFASAPIQATSQSKLRAAVVSITHFSKGAGQSAVNSFIGSIGFIAAARAAFIVTRDPDNDDRTRRLFVQAKNNLAGDCGGLAFRVEQHLVGKDIVASAVTWESERITRTADEILAAGREANEKPERSEAEEFLRDVLIGWSSPINGDRGGGQRGGGVVAYRSPCSKDTRHQAAPEGRIRGDSARLDAGTGRYRGTARPLRWPIFPMMATFQTWTP